MKPYSREIPWVRVLRMQGQPFFFCQCDVCGEEASLDGANVAQFAIHHSVHQAPDGSLRLGDRLAAIAKPIAGMLGQEPCTPCEARRRALNQVRLPRKWF